MSFFERFLKRGAADEAAAEHQGVLAEGGEAALPVQPRIGRDEIRRAAVILNRYKGDKARLDQKIVANEQWWKLRHWEQFRTGDKKEVTPSSAWLWNCIVSKHADAMDAYPEPNIRPRMADDIQEARRLRDIMPALLEQNDFQSAYSAMWWDKLKFGAGAYGVFWDGKRHNGLGDIAVNNIDLLSLYWESGVSDIQESPNLFYVTLVDNELLESQYPQLKNKLSQPSVRPVRYRYDDRVDTAGKSSVVDWYYKRRQNGRQLLHYCRFVNDELLFATENDPAAYPNGWYDHGMYPFVIDQLFPIKGTPVGYSYIDIGKSAQEQIDVLNQAIVKNAAAAARPRYFIRSDGGVNEAEFADLSNDFVHFNGVIDSTSLVPITSSPLSDIYVSILNNKIEELKETTGNRDVINGGSTSGVTAASGIAAMQEASGKLSRDANMQSYNAFRRVVLMCIELMRQYYTAPRWFRIRGEMGKEEYISFDNKRLKNQPVGGKFGEQMMFRTPVFDVEVNAQKAAPYSKMAQNELALQLNGQGVFAPGNARPALALLNMMDFSHKDEVMQKVAENDSVMQAAQLGLQLASRFAPELLPQLPQMPGVGAPTGGTASAMPAVRADGSLAGAEEKHMQRARSQALDSVQVRS